MSKQIIVISEAQLQRKVLSLSGIATALLVFIVGVSLANGQSLTGEWKASVNEKSPDKIHLSFERRTENGGKNQNGSSFSYSDLQGLSREAAQNGKASFRLVRDAGTIECEGTFVNGKGSGTFTFAPNQAYVEGMRSRGFDIEKQGPKHSATLEEKLLSAALLTVSFALADDLRAANFPNLGFDDLYSAAIFKIDGKFMAEMKATGFPNLAMEDLVKARIFKIDADFVRKIKDMGFGTDNFETLVKYSIFKVTPEFLADLKSAGLNDLTAEQIVQLRIFKIDADYVRRARAEEPNVTVEQLVEMKIGVRRRSGT